MLDKLSYLLSPFIGLISILMRKEWSWIYGHLWCNHSVSAERFQCQNFVSGWQGKRELCGCHEAFVLHVREVIVTVETQCKQRKVLPLLWVWGIWSPWHDCVHFNRPHSPRASSVPHTGSFGIWSSWSPARLTLSSRDLYLRLLSAGIIYTFLCAWLFVWLLEIMLV